MARSNPKFTLRRLHAACEQCFRLDTHSLSQSIAKKSLSTTSSPVTTLTETLVTPSKPTPAATLPLSSIDSHPIVAFNSRMLQVYAHAGQAPAPARTIRDALAKALVYYYPIAGRFVADAKSKLPIQVDCNGKGAWFREARALCTLKDVRHLGFPYLMPPKELIPFDQEEDDDDPILRLQVTQFTCGGVVVGVNISHAMVDGTGLGQFLNAVAELARGYKRPSINPVWLRETYPSHFAKESPPIFQIGSLDHPPLHHHVADVPAKHINQVKKDYMERMGVKCTTFEVLAASIWQCRTRAIEFDPHTNVTLTFAANTRALLSDVFPAEGGYYGNSAHVVRVTASSQCISNASILEVVKLIGDAKAEFASKFVRWRRGDFDEDPLKMDANYGTLVVTDVRRLGLKEIDYGWGTPSRFIFPADVPYIVPTCLLYLNPTDENSCRAMTVCVKEEHFATFQHEMEKLA